MTAPVALVTGGTSGLGAVVVQRLIDDGYRIVSGGRSSSEATEFAGVTQCRIDVRDVKSIDAAFTTACGMGPLRVVVACHGVVFTTSPTTMRDEDLVETIEVNLAGTARVFRAAANCIESGGAMVAVGSIGGSRSHATTRIAYGASKAGMEALTRYYAVGLASRAVRVNVVLPGPLEHSMAGTPSPKSGDDSAVESLIPLGRRLTCREVADTVAFLASPLASGVTGAAVPVDGGLLAT